jgi:hypothetical protein
MTKNKDAAFTPVEHIARSIRILRGQRVLDANLAALYGVPTGALIQAVSVTSSASRRISCCSSLPTSGQL